MRSQMHAFQIRHRTGIVRHAIHHIIFETLFMEVKQKVVVKKLSKSSTRSRIFQLVLNFFFFL